MSNRANILKQKFQDSLALPFEQVLPEAVIQQVLEEQGVSYRQTLYTPIVTMWAWMSQVLDSDKSLGNAVSRVKALLATAGETIPVSDTGAYSKAMHSLTPGSAQPPVKTNCSSSTSGGQVGATVVRATGKSIRWHHGNDERYSCQPKGTDNPHRFPTRYAATPKI